MVVQLQFWLHVQLFGDLDYDDYNPLIGLIIRNRVKDNNNALSIRSLLECPLTQPPNETARHSHNLPMRQPDNARKVVFVHGRLPQFYLTQIQRICGGGNKVDFWTPSQNCAKFQWPAFTLGAYPRSHQACELPYCPRLVPWGGPKAPAARRARTFGQRLFGPSIFSVPVFIRPQSFWAIVDGFH